jgi:hypothetical protein
VTRDSRRAADAITTLLTRHGYQQKSDNKHLRLEAKDSFAGLEALTLAKTPSDTRALKNMKAQIIRALGILKLSE